MFLSTAPLNNFFFFIDYIYKILFSNLILPTNVDLIGRSIPGHSGPQINPLIIVPNSKFLVDF